MSDLSDNDKSEIYQYLYRNTPLTHDQVWAALQSVGYEKAFKKIASKYKLQKSIEDVTT